MQVNVRGLPVNYVEHGSGREIVFLHGRPADHRLLTTAFEPIFEARPGWRRIYLDLPGMGRTPGAAWIRTIHDVLDVVDGAISSILPGAPFALVGASYGGYLALGLVHRRAAGLTGLALVAPAVEWDDEQLRRPPRRVFHVDADTVATLTDEERFWTSVSVVQVPETLAAFRAGVLPGMRIADHDFLARIDDGGPLSVDVRRLAEPFERPTLILAGRQDTNVGYQDAIELLESYPRATLAVLDRAGHGLRAEQQTLFRALTNEWLDRMELEEPRNPAAPTPPGIETPRGTSTLSDPHHT
ncbi:MAG: alpha/beta fold hydrolase [Myxococcales bacterium]